MRVNVYQERSGSRSISVLVPEGMPFPAMAPTVIKDPEMSKTIELDQGTPRVALDVTDVLAQIARRGFAVVSYVVKVTEILPTTAK